MMVVWRYEEGVLLPEVFTVTMAGMTIDSSVMISLLFWNRRKCSLHPHDTTTVSASNDCGVTAISQAISGQTVVASSTTWTLFAAITSSKRTV